MESFIAEAPKELERLKTEKGVMTFANMLVDMEYQVVKNEEFRKAIAARYDAVLIDEFQDTDPIQFNIFRTLFLAPKTPEGEAPEEQKPLIFVGDPKQSIYAFRSADLDTYLDARDEVAKVCVLEKNFRSHPGIVESINTVFSLSKPESSFLNPRIGFEPVKYSNRGGLYELGKDEEGNPVKKPLPPFTLWKYEEAVDPSLFNADGEFQKPSAQDLYSQEARLVAEDIVRLTSGSVYMEGKHGDRPVHPSDVCVLVRKRSDAENLKKELRKRKIRYIIKIDESVLASPEAREIEVILEAIENPKNRSAMANARATNIFGETLRDIEENTEAGLTARLQIEEAGRDIETRGVLAAFKKLFVRRRVEERLLRTDSGERMLTNYDHVLELLYKASRRVKTASGILRWLQDAVADGKDGDDYKLRLESDADLVRIETIHTSKGLEFPIVYTLRNTYFKASKPYPKNVFDGEAKGKKVTWLNIGGGWDEKSYPPYKAAQLQENCRLLYVALTRAGCYLGVPYLMPVNKPKKKGVMDFGKGGAETTLGRVLTGAETPTAAGVLKALHELKAQVTPLGCLVKDVTPEYKKDHDKPSVSDADLHWKKDADDTLSAAPAAHVASDWGRTSFTGMTQAIEEDKEQPALDENDDFPEETDEAEVPKSAAPSSPDPDPFRYKDRATPATAYGDFVHKLLEAVRFDDPDPAEIRKTVASVFDRMDIKSAAPAGEEGATDEELRARHIEALSVMVENVLCAQALAPLPEFRLKMLSEKEKASEMDFLLSNNMTEEGTTLTARELSNALEALDPEKYGGLHLNEKQPLTGYLSGSIDLAFAADGKFWIIDWKTNFLSENAADYSGQVLEEAMQKKHYKLQYLLYLAALKRHLKLRFGFENPYEHIGGAAYFFLRGVKAGSGRGIYFDRPDAAVIGCIDELLAKGWNEDTVKKYKELMKNSKEGA
jgi:exodeoxyribonuclease V beta subunit